MTNQVPPAARALTSETERAASDGETDRRGGLGGMMKDQLGERLREERERRSLSLRAVASSVGISPSMLSQVETGKIHPSVTTLYSLVTYLEVSLDDLLGLAQAAPGTTSVASRTHGLGVQRAGENPTIEMENGVTWERLANAGNRGTDPLIMTYKPGASSSAEGKLMRHAGTEYGYLLEGELTLMLDFDSFTLRVGDSVCFDSHRPHLYRNDTQHVARGIWFVTEPLGEVPVPRAAEQRPEHVSRSASVRRVLRQEE